MIKKLLGLMPQPPTPLADPRPGYISRETYLGPENWADLSEQVQDNVDDLLLRVNEFIDEFYKWLLVKHPNIVFKTYQTSGKRTMIHHRAIYAQINKVRAQRIQQPIPVPEHSSHLDGNGIDLFDGFDLIKEFIKESAQLMDRLDLCYEMFEFTDNWVHLQRVHFRSFNGSTRGFRPY